MDLIDRQNRTRSVIEAKLNREKEEQQLYEDQIARMEKEEMELITRLKNTKLLEDQAYI